MCVFSPEIFLKRSNKMKTFGLILILVELSVVNCDHFGGGVFMWAPVNNSNYVSIFVKDYI